jgi:hypothetical protein
MSTITNARSTAIYCYVWTGTKITLVSTCESRTSLFYLNSFSFLLRTVLSFVDHWKSQSTHTTPTHSFAFDVFKWKSTSTHTTPTHSFDFDFENTLDHWQKNSLTKPTSSCCIVLFQNRVTHSTLTHLITITQHLNALFLLTVTWSL